MALAPERSHANGIAIPSSNYGHTRQLNPLKRPADDSQDNNEQRLTKRLHLLHLGQKSSHAFNPSVHGCELTKLSIPDKANALRSSFSTPHSPTQLPIHPSPSSPKRTQKQGLPSKSPHTVRNNDDAILSSSRPAAGPSHARRISDTEGMQVEDTPNRVYINDLDAEIAELEAAEQAQANDEAKTIRMASALAAKLSQHGLLNPRSHIPNLSQSTLRRFQPLLDRIPPQTPPSAPPESDSNQGALVLYSLPSSLSVPAEQDGVRAAVEGARLRARQRQMAWGDSVASSGAETAEGSGSAGMSVKEQPERQRLTHDWRGVGGAGDLCAVDGAGEDMDHDEDAMDIG